MARNKHPEETVKAILDAATTLFIEKGYDNASMQDILDVTKLSKGAIYHHFRSKEDILEAICNRIMEGNMGMLSSIRDDPLLNGRDKMVKLFKTTLLSQGQHMILHAAPSMLDNPRFLAMQIRLTYSLTVPQFVLPIIRQGVEDGSIQTEYPKELSEILLTLTGIWLNPLVHAADPHSIRKRCLAFNKLLQGTNIVLFDEEAIRALADYNTAVQNPPIEELP